MSIEIKQLRDRAWLQNNELDNVRPLNPYRSNR